MLNRRGTGQRSCSEEKRLHWADAPTTCTRNSQDTNDWEGTVAAIRRRQLTANAVVGQLTARTKSRKSVADSREEQRSDGWVIEDVGGQGMRMH